MNSLNADFMALAHAMEFTCPECGHDYRDHLGVIPGCKDCPGHQGIDNPGACSHTMSTALGSRIAEAAWAAGWRSPEDIEDDELK